MKNSILLGLLALSSTIFAATTANVDVSANLIRAVEITAQASTTNLSITNTQIGSYSFPETNLDITGAPGAAVKLVVPQTLLLTKTGDSTKKTTANVTFKSGAITTDGTTATAVHILTAEGSVQNALLVSGELATALDAGAYRGTLEIEANYN